MIKSFQKPLLIALAVTSFALVAQSAGAGVIDYGWEAEFGSGERGYLNSDGGFAITTADGITVTATAGTGPDPDNPWTDSAYLDSYYSGRPGGLGVCQQLDGSNQCTPSDDDNLTMNGHVEELILTFSEEVTISEILIRNGLHDTDFYDYGPEVPVLYQFTLNTIYYNLMHTFNPPGSSGTGLEFIFTAPSGDTDNARMYIEKIEFARVPEPSTLLLLGSGLVGLGLVRRRFKG